MSDTPAAPDLPPTVVTTPLRLRYHAVSDVGRVRKDNQDSGYAGPWLLAVCDGVGGAARGDIASSTAINELRVIDAPPTELGLLTRVSDGLHDAHDSIGAQVDADMSLNGTSTTATVALFDGARLGIGHIGDSRAYLLRDGEISQLTSDHTFVQSLIDEGRITEAEARVHPHRNLILKALDGLHDVEPDLFQIELVAGDRIMLCSDGCCGVLEDDRLADILRDTTPEFAAVELVRASLEAGSSDNVTCVVAEVITDDQARQDPSYSELRPFVVGAAAELKRRLPRALFRGHRSGDTGELEPIEAEIPAGVDYAIRADPPIDPEVVRYALRPPERFAWMRRLFFITLIVGIVWVAVASGWWWTQRQYYIGEHQGNVAIFRGVSEIPGLSSVYYTSDVDLDDLVDSTQDSIKEGIPADSLEEARQKLDKVAKDTRDENTDPQTDPITPTSSDGLTIGPSDSPTSSPTSNPTSNLTGNPSDGSTAG